MKPLHFTALLVLSVMAALFLNGCTVPSGILPEETPAPAMQSFTDPTASLETAEPVELSGNPVTALYEAYGSASGSITPFYTQLSSSATTDSLKALLILSEHQAMLTKAGVSIGRMTSSGSYYSESLIGAATGYGTMSSSDGLYTFRFEYDSGDVLTGSLEGTRLDFHIASASLEALVTLSETNGTWFSRVNSGEMLSILEITSDHVRFAYTPLPKVAPTPTPRPTPTPAPEYDEDGEEIIAASPSPTPLATQPPVTFTALLLEYPGMTVFDSRFSLSPAEDAVE